MRIYISGAISSDSNFREKFQEAARKLYVAGHTPISPTDLPPCLTEGEYLQLDHLLIGFADAVFMLDDWTKSKGAMIEYELAIHMNKPVYFQGSAKNEQALGLRAYKPGGAWVYEEGYLDEAKREHAAYMREYRRKNPEKTREINRRYWEKKAKEKAAEKE